MKLEATEGCMCYSYSIDGVNISDYLDENSEKYNPQFLKDVLIKLIESGKCDCMLESIFPYIVTQVGDSEFDFHCDDCGDDVYTYTIDL